MNDADPPGKFTSHLDLSRVGVVGHSFGGAAALKFCHEDSRCQAVIDMDGAAHGNVIETGVDRPLMILLSDHSRESGLEADQIMSDLRSVRDHAPANTTQFIAIRGSNHFLFSDDGALLKSHVLMGSLRMLGVVSMDGRRQLAVTSYCLRSFFDAYLKMPSGSSVSLMSPLYPEIEAVR
jgi:pimeloyl-ACP methyl ester carboxylesterase